MQKNLVIEIDTEKASLEELEEAEEKVSQFHAGLLYQIKMRKLAQRKYHSQSQ